MLERAQIRCRIDPATAALQFQCDCVTARFLDVLLTVPAMPSVIETEQELQFTVDLRFPHQFCARSDEVTVRVTTSDSQDADEFANMNLKELIGFLSALFLFPGSEDLLWVCPRFSESSWVLGAKWVDQDNCEGMLAVCKRQANMDWSFYIAGTDVRAQLAPRLYRLFCDQQGLGLPRAFPFCADEGFRAGGSAHALVVKLHPSELWFLVYPIDAFCGGRFPGFEQYSTVGWVLSDKTFVQNSLQRNLIREELRDEEHFLKHAVVMVNTYPQLYCAAVSALCARGTGLLVRMLSLLKDISYNGETLSLRWYVNPTPGQVHAELVNPSTRYLLADFHVPDEEWQAGTGTIESWSGGTPPCDFPDLSFVRGLNLSHIRLMRLFHCNSLADPRSDAQRPPIVQALLDSGATCVEGCPGEEDLLEHLCSLLVLLTQEGGLWNLLVLKCWEKEIDSQMLKSEAEDFMKSCKTLSETNRTHTEWKRRQ